MPRAGGPATFMRLPSADLNEDPDAAAELCAYPSSRLGFTD